MKPRVHRTKLGDKFQSSFDDFLRKSPRSYVLKGFSKFHEKLATLLLDLQMRFKFWKQIIEKFACGNPMVNNTIVDTSFGRSGLQFGVSAKCGAHPVSGLPFTARDNQFDVKLVTAAVAALLNLARVKTTVSVNVASQIDDIIMGMISLNFDNFRHHISLVRWYRKDAKRRSKKSQPQRLSPSGSIKDQSTVRTLVKTREGGITRLPATRVVIKVTDCLNEAAQRLGVSLNEMGDVKLNLNNLENLKAA